VAWFVKIGERYVNVEQISTVTKIDGGTHIEMLNANGFTVELTIGEVMRLFRGGGG
jgi:hypothetical protein